MGATGFLIDRERLHSRWPTHACPPEFWEELGRTVAALGFLEDCLKRANLAITATREYNSTEEAQEAFSEWERDLERSLDETLGTLAARFVGALHEDDRFRANEVSEIAGSLKMVADWRNALCHGAWTDYDAGSGQATLRYWPRKGWREHSERPISRADLAKIGCDAVDITIRVINTVTKSGIQFPGASSPGTEVLPPTGK